MSDQSFAVQRATRGKLVLHARAGEPIGRPLSEWGYRTPRFPDGIKGSALSSSDEGIQRETAAVWFLANYVPVTGPYFGFAEAAPKPAAGTLGSDLFNSTMLNGGAPVAGFNQAPFFDGAQSLQILKAEFKDTVPQNTLTQVAAIFGGLWKPILEEAIVDRSAPASEWVASLITALDAFAVAIEMLRQSPSGNSVRHCRAF